MSQIRRKTYSEPSSPDKEEVDSLKNSVENLQCQVSDLMGQLGDLTKLVKSLLEEKAATAPVVAPSSLPVSQPPSEPWLKRMKPSFPSAPSSMEEPQFVQEYSAHVVPAPKYSRPSDASLLEWSESSGIDYFMGDRSLNLFGDDMQ